MLLCPQRVDAGVAKLCLAAQPPDCCSSVLRRILSSGPQELIPIGFRSCTHRSFCLMDARVGQHKCCRLPNLMPHALSMARTSNSKQHFVLSCATHTQPIYCMCDHARRHECLFLCTHDFKFV